MQLSQEQIDSLWNKFYTLGAKALLIRDFWKINTDTLTIDFDEDENTDPWRLYKSSALNSISMPKETTPNKRTVIISKGVSRVDSYYKELIYGTYDGEYTYTIQDEKTLSILDDLLSKYPEESYIDLFSFSRKDEDKLEYLETTNPLLSLLRLEYEKHIDIQDILLFDFTRSKRDNFFIEGKVKLKKLKIAPTNLVSMVSVIENFFLNETNGAVLLNGIELGRISPETKEYYFFKCLYEKYDTFVTHMDIKNYIKQHNDTIDKKTDGNSEVNIFCSDTKANIINAIRQYIHPTTGKYILRNVKYEKKRKKK